MDITDVGIAGVVCCFVVIVGDVQFGRHHRRSVWVKQWILQRPVHIAYSQLVNYLLNIDKAVFRNLVRMDLIAATILC